MRVKKIKNHVNGHAGVQVDRVMDWNSDNYAHRIFLKQELSGGVARVAKADAGLAETVCVNPTGVPRLQENAPPYDPTVGLCLGS